MSSITDRLSKIPVKYIVAGAAAVVGVTLLVIFLMRRKSKKEVRA